MPIWNTSSLKLNGMPLLSILICTIETRREYLSRLLSILEPQISLRLADIELLIDCDNGEISIGEKRQRLLTRSTSPYICYIDDDDVIAENYIELVLTALSTAPDCVGFIQSMRNKSLTHYAHTIRPSTRYPNHLNPIKRGIALAVGFEPLNRGEDTLYSERIRPLINSETFIDWPIYEYQFREHETRHGEITNANTSQICN